MMMRNDDDDDHDHDEFHIMSRTITKKSKT